MASASAEAICICAKSHGVYSARMLRPNFSGTMQIGIVVPDLDTAIDRYQNDYGIGPWQMHKFTPGEVKEWREHGRLVKGEPRRASRPR